MHFAVLAFYIVLKVYIYDGIGGVKCIGCCTRASITGRALDNDHLFIH